MSGSRWADLARRLAGHRPVVRVGVHVTRDGARDRHLGHLLGAPVEQPPDALVAVQIGQLTEGVVREGDRVAAAVLVAADGQRRAAAAGQQRPHRLRRHAGLVAEHQHHDVAAQVDGAEGRGDRGRAALAVVVVDDHVGALEVHGLAHVVGGAAERDDDLVEGARTGDVDDVAQQRPVAVGQQLLGAPQALGAARAEHEPGHEGVRHCGGSARPCIALHTRAGVHGMSM